MSANNALGEEAPTTRVNLLGQLQARKGQTSRRSRGLTFITRCCLDKLKTEMGMQWRRMDLMNLLRIPMSLDFHVMRPFGFGDNHSRSSYSPPQCPARSITTMSSRSTLIKPPPATDRAPIEDVLELTQLEDINPNLFTNTRPLWHPPGARGIYGGAVIAQCLAAAQRTVPKDFVVHSMHCYFVLNGNSEIPVIYHVEHVREGRSFATRTVQARQRGQPIFTTTLSFTREGSGGAKKVEHAATMREVAPPKEVVAEDFVRGTSSPFISQRMDIVHNDSPRPHEKRALQWVKARGKISAEGGHQAHLSAMAYMSDSYFIGTVWRVHKLWRFSTASKDVKKSGISPEMLKQLKTMDEAALRKMEFMDDEVIAQIRAVEIKDGEIVMTERRPEIGMMVSLDHTIYFHNPKAFRADEWMFTEMESPWAGDGRGLVMQKIYTQDGILIASCVQEGVVRLKQDGPAPSSSKL
nr:acyl-coenzyme a thioesterase 8 [Quercus suber]